MPDGPGEKGGPERCWADRWSPDILTGASQLIPVRPQRIPEMSFSTDMAELVASQLSRFVTLNRHQLSGQVANLAFWLAQVRHSLAVIDGYGVRFLRMEAAQEQYVVADGTTVSEVTPTGPAERK